MSCVISSIKNSPAFTKTLPPSPSLETSGKADDHWERDLRDKMEHFASTSEGREFSQALDNNNQLVSCGVLSMLLARFLILQQFLSNLIEMGEDITQPLSNLEEKYPNVSPIIPHSNTTSIFICYRYSYAILLFYDTSNAIPMKGVVRKVMRHTRTSGGVLQTALIHFVQLTPVSLSAFHAAVSAATLLTTKPTMNTGCQPPSSPAAPAYVLRRSRSIRQSPTDVQADCAPFECRYAGSVKIMHTV
ncbi:hypothetical protein EV368DRAFT_90204 [Lentinula lateritia]|nr:hypothetical protein EV368DRAFT_90204 [Lentinula lateritia]